MKLPNCKNAFIAKEKIKDYLLSNVHPTGRSKSKFFRAFGFDEDNMDMFEQFLHQIAKTCDIVKEERSFRGVKYVVDGQLYTPIGKTVYIRTVWIIENDDDRPRFVTAYPK